MASEPVVDSTRRRGDTAGRFSVAFSRLNHQHQRMLPILEDQLGEPALNEAMTEHRIALWDELATWEAKHFLEQRLGRHQLDPAWTHDLTLLSRTAPPGTAYC